MDKKELLILSDGQDSTIFPEVAKQNFKEVHAIQISSIRG